MCVICALGHAGWAAQVIHLCLGTRTQRVLFFLFLVCGCGLAGTHYTYPCQGLDGWSALLQCSACDVVSMLMPSLLCVRLNPWF